MRILEHKDQFTQKIKLLRRIWVELLTVLMFKCLRPQPTRPQKILLCWKAGFSAVRVLGRLLWSDSDSWAIVLRICFRLVKHRKDEKLEMLQNHPSRNLSAKSKSLNLWLSCEWGKWTVRGPRSSWRLLNNVLGCALYFYSVLTQYRVLTYCTPTAYCIGTQSHWMFCTAHIL